jgi:hypothetical protein
MMLTELTAMVSVEPLPSFVCPISMAVMSDPVFTADGHTYEREAIVTWMCDTSQDPTSPMTGEPLCSRALVPNHVLKRAIADWKQHHSQLEQKLSDVRLVFNNYVTTVAEAKAFADAEVAEAKATGGSGGDGVEVGGSAKVARTRTTRPPPLTSIAPRAAPSKGMPTPVLQI